MPGPYQGGGSHGKPFTQAGVIVAIQLMDRKGHVRTHMIKPVPFEKDDMLAIGCIGSEVILTATEKHCIENGYAPTSVLEEHVRFVVLED